MPRAMLLMMLHAAITITLFLLILRRHQEMLMSDEARGVMRCGALAMTASPLPDALHHSTPADRPSPSPRLTSFDRSPLIDSGL